MEDQNTHAARRRLPVVEKPRVAVRLMSHRLILTANFCHMMQKSHVGKKLTKLDPRSKEHVISEKIQTFGSFTASFTPCMTL